MLWSLNKNYFAGSGFLTTFRPAIQKYTIIRYKWEENRKCLTESIKVIKIIFKDV